MADCTRPAGAAGGEQVGLHHLDLVGQVQAGQVFARAGQGALVLVGGDDAFDAALCQHGRQHARARADVEGQRGARRQGASATSCTYSPRTGENTP
jgi:hypothetical protein